MHFPHRPDNIGAFFLCGSYRFLPEEHRVEIKNSYIPTLGRIRFDYR